jgi:hypothetical protein
MAMVQGLLLFALYLGAQGLTLWAFVDALIRPAGGFVASGKLTKPAWAAITGLSALVIFWMQNPMTLFGLPAVIAAIVYLVDVRPAVRGLPRGNSW